MTTCTRCHRPLKLPTATGMGLTCSKKVQAQPVPAHERDLFGYDLEKATNAARYRLQVFIGGATAEAQMSIRRNLHAARGRVLGWRAQP